MDSRRRLEDRARPATPAPTVELRPLRLAVQTRPARTGGAHVAVYLTSYLACLVFVAWLAARGNQPGGLAFIASTISISLLGFVVVFNPWQRDLLEPVKIASAYYALAFGVGPLFIGPLGAFDIWLLSGRRDATVDKTALLALGGMIAMLVGYFIVSRIWHTRAGAVARLKQGRTLLNFGALLLLTIGLVCYVVLVLRSGGIGHFLSYTGGRADIFQETFGGFYWGAFFLFSAVAIIAAANWRSRPLTTLAAVAAVSALFALFQGRDAALAPVFMGIVAWHYRRALLKPRTIAILFGVLLLAATLLGFYRKYDERESGAGVGDVIVAFTQSAIEEQLTRTIAADIEKMDVFAIIVRYIDGGGELLEGRSMLSWLGPLNRHLFTDAIDSVAAGPLLHGIVYPEQRGARTGIIPSLPGELYLNFGPFGPILGLFIYGIVLSMMYRFIRRGSEGSDLRLALYLYALWVVPKMLIDGTHLLFKLATVEFGIMLVVMLVAVVRPRSVPPPRRTAALATASDSNRA